MAFTFLDIYIYIYINDIVTDTGSNIRLFAGYTSLYVVVEDPITAAICLNTDLDKISRWAQLGKCPSILLRLNHSTILVN